MKEAKRKMPRKVKSVAELMQSEKITDDETEDTDSI